MAYRRRFFGEDPWFTSSYQNVVGADAPMWGDIAAPALEEDEAGRGLRLLYIANALLPYLNPYTRALFTNRIIGQAGDLAELPQTGASEGATLGGVVPGYVSSPALPLSSQGFYNNAGAQAEALGASMGALKGIFTDDSEQRLPDETLWLQDVARQVGQVAPKAGESWTYGQVQDYNDLLYTLGAGAPDEMWSDFVQQIFNPVRKAVDVTWANAPGRSAASWFS